MDRSLSGESNYGKILRNIFLWLTYIGLFIVSSCNVDEGVQPVTTTPFIFPDIQHFPSELNIPDQNPTTLEGVVLGRYLFYDGRLSGRDHPDSLMTCATCHIQSQGFEVSINHPKFQGGHPFGLPTDQYPTGKKTPHMTMPLINLLYNPSGYLLNGMIENYNDKRGPEGYDFMGDNYLSYKYLESLIWMAILAEHEIAGSIEKTVEMIASIDKYRPMFKAAFGSEEVNIDRISKAIGQFVRTIIAKDFKFYKYVRHETELSPAELRGYELFFSEEGDCFHCHAGSLLMTTNEYFNNAKDTVFSDSRDRFSVTGNLMHTGAYRAPSLINCELNGPYMHDGRYTTLDEVIDFYSEGLVYSEYVDPLMKAVKEKGVQLSDEEKSDLKAFLLTLTDYNVLNNPDYACPEDLGIYGIK